MDHVPVSPKRRRHYEAAIRVTDLVVYAAVLLGGVAAVFATPTSVVDQLLHTPILIAVWAVLLIGGGLVGFIGRLTRYWLIEGPATVSAFFGALIYLVLLINVALSSSTTTVAAALIFVAMAGLFRRWLELQIFGSEPGAGWRQRIRAATKRRTANVVPRDF